MVRLDLHPKLRRRLQKLSVGELAAVESALEQLLQGFAAHELRGLHVKRVMLQGDPASAIREYADTENVDLIAMPTHGYGPFRRLVF